MVEIINLYLDLGGFTRIIFKKNITLSQRNTNLFKVFILLQYSPQHKSKKSTK